MIKFNFYLLKKKLKEPNKIIKNKDQELLIKGKNKIFDKNEKTNPENLELLSSIKKKELPEIKKSNQETIELLSPGKKKIILKEIEPTNLEIKPKKRIIEKTKSDNFELLKNKNEKKEIPFEKINEDSFYIKGKNDEEEIVISDNNNKSIQKNKYILRTGKSSKPIYNENDMNNVKKDSNLKMYQMLILNLNQLFKKKSQNYQKDFLNRLKDNLFKIIIEEEEIKRQKEIEKKEKDIPLIITKNKTNLEEQKEKSKLFSTTQNSLEYTAEENPKLRIRKRNLQSLSSENYSDNYINVLLDYRRNKEKYIY